MQATKAEKLCQRSRQALTQSSFTASASEYPEEFLASGVKAPGMKIDVVYTWVDGGNPEYWKLVRQYATEKKDMNPERFRDAFQMLRYSMRALHQFAGDWVGKVYVLTARPQCPPWLRVDHPDVVLKHHDEFFRHPEVLPTFSCLNIEPEMHNLPCSDPFLYFNDDYLLGAPIGPQQFCDLDGNIRVFGTLIGERFPWRIRQGGISLGFTEHTPIWIDKTAYEATNRMFEDLYQRTLRCRFRQDWNYRIERAYRYYLLAHTRKRRVVPFWQALREVAFHKITNDERKQQRQLARIERRRPPFICLNDDQGDHPNPRVTELVQNFLDRYYPRPSPWEKT